MRNFPMEDFLKSITQKEILKTVVIFETEK